eukprot:2280046-Rhodomonas_salina.1
MTLSRYHSSQRIQLLSLLALRVTALDTRVPGYSIAKRRSSEYGNPLEHSLSVRDTSEKLQAWIPGV